jgi:hypothetical protein
MVSIQPGITLEEVSTLPANEVLGLGTKRDIVREVQRLAPVYDLPVRIVAILGAEWWPADETLEHDGSEGPPIAVKRIAVLSEDLGCNVIRRADSRVRHQPTRSPPVVDNATVAHSQVDLVNCNRVPIPSWPAGFPLE